MRNNSDSEKWSDEASDEETDSEEEIIMSSYLRIQLKRVAMKKQKT